MSEAVVHGFPPIPGLNTHAASPPGLRRDSQASLRDSAASPQGLRRESRSSLRDIAQGLRRDSKASLRSGPASPLGLRRESKPSFLDRRPSTLRWTEGVKESLDAICSKLALMEDVLQAQSKMTAMLQAQGSAIEKLDQVFVLPRGRLVWTMGLCGSHAPRGSVSWGRVVARGLFRVCSTAPLHAQLTTSSTRGARAK